MHPLFDSSAPARACRAVAALFATLPAMSQDRPGYTDTPLIPGQRWRVHDAERPAPPAVDPGAAPEVPAEPPSDAIVLFSGENLDAFTGKDGEARWKIEDGAFEVNGTGDIETRRHFGDCQLHIEWRTPVPPSGSGQGRGNSGVFLMGRYEVQVLDSHDNPTYADGQAAALYGQYPPDVNASRAPGEWQSYDIVFHAPRFAEDGALVSPAVVTVFHNGVLVHDHREFLGPTAHRSEPRYVAHPPEGPIRLQDHGDPVRFRNVWVRPLGERSTGER